MTKLSKHEKMIVSKYLDNSTFKCFINKFNLNDMYFSSFNYVFFNLNQHYTVLNIKNKIDNTIKNFPNLKEIVIGINIDKFCNLHFRKISNNVYNFIQKVEKIKNDYDLNIIYQFNYNKILYDIGNTEINYLLNFINNFKSTIFYLVFHNINLLNKYINDFKNFKNVKFIFETRNFNEILQTSNLNIYYNYDFIHENYKDTSKTRFYTYNDIINNGYIQNNYVKFIKPNYETTFKNTGSYYNYLSDIEKYSKIIYQNIKFKSTFKNFINFTDNDNALNEELHLHKNYYYINQFIKLYKYGVKNIYSKLINFDVIYNHLILLDYIRSTIIRIIINSNKLNFNNFNIRNNIKEIKYYI